jgi:hypothetical protein
VRPEADMEKGRKDRSHVILMKLTKVGRYLGIAPGELENQR